MRRIAVEVLRVDPAPGEIDRQVVNPSRTDHFHKMGALGAGTWWVWQWGELPAGEELVATRLLSTIARWHRISHSSSLTSQQQLVKTTSRIAFVR